MELVEKILNKFQTAAQELLDQLAAQIAANDAQQVAALAHRLKGMAANLSANELQQAAYNLELLARETTLATGPELLAQVRTEVAHCLNDIPSVLAKIRPS